MPAMKNFIILSISIILTPLALAQSLADLPTCAQEAALAGITSTGCDITDIACVCKSVPFLQALRSTITTTCSPNDQAQALIFAQTLCSSVGIAIDVPPIPGASSAPPVSVVPMTSSAAPPPASSESAKSVPTAVTSATPSPSTATDGSSATVSATPSPSIATDGSSATVSDTAAETAAVPFTGAANPMAYVPVTAAVLVTLGPLFAFL